MELTALMDSKLHGFGLKSKGDTFEAGQRILTMAPMLEMETWNRDDPGASRKNPEEFRNALIEPREETAQGVIDTFLHYSYPFTPKDKTSRFRLFKNLALLNHRCVPNATLHWNNDDQCMVLHAKEDISDAEEITISYIDLFQPKQKRHEDLGFVCNCMVCANQGIERFFANRASEIRQMDDFRRKYLDDSADGMRLADDGVLRAIFLDTGIMEMQGIAKQFNTKVKSGGGWPCQEAADAYQLRHIIYMAVATNIKNEKRRDNAINLAHNYKIAEMETLWKCYGARHPRVKVVAAQLFHISESDREKWDDAVGALKSLGGEVVFLDTENVAERYQVARASS